MEMWGTIGAAITLLSTIVGYFVLRKKNSDDTAEGSKEYARSKSRKNESADDRQDILDQRKRIEELGKKPEEPKP